MARDLRVNALHGSEEESQRFEDFREGGFDGQPPDSAVAVGRLAIGRAKPLSSPHSPALGTCLYLGPRGQRCALPSMDGGFCRKHRPGAGEAGTSVTKKVLGAVVAVLGILWPYIADLVREIIRWIHHH